MGENPRTVRAEMLVQEALRIMSEHKIDQVIVVDSDNRPIGMLDIQDVVGVKS